LLNTAKNEEFTFNESKSVISLPQLDLLGYRVSKGQIEPDPTRMQPLLDLPILKTQKELKRCLGMNVRLLC